jgi:hypothetical protein
MYARTNITMAAEVNNGLRIDAAQGPLYAWSYLEYCRVPQSVILRVLTESQDIRGTGMDFESGHTKTIGNGA